MAADEHTIITALNTYAASRTDIVAVYLFGSYAAGRSRAASDLDIAIMTRHDIPEEQRIALETDLSCLLGRDVDLVIFARSGPLLQHQILKNGRRIYESDSKERVRQEVFSRSEYLDTRFLYQELRDAPHG